MNPAPYVVSEVRSDIPCQFAVSRVPLEPCGKPAAVWVRVTTPDLISDYPVCAEHAPA